MDRLIAILAGLLMPTLAAAQEWQMQQFDDGSFFSAAINPPGQGGFSIVCGERSPGRLTAAQTGNTRPDITPRDTFRLNFSRDDIGAASDQTAPRQDVLIVIGTTGYRLPVITWNAQFSTWETDLPANDPVFVAIAANPAFELRSTQTAYMVSSAGFAGAFSALAAHCQTMFTAIGMPWRLAAPAEQSALAPMQQAAEIAILRGCGGPAIRQPGTFLTGEIDGDGLDDLVLFWDAIRCQTGDPRPYCGASLCSAQVFLSTLYPRKGQPEEPLAQSVGLQQLSNGNMGISVTGSMATCQLRPALGCTILFYWNGADLVPLN